MMCKSQIWIIFVIFIYGNQSTDQLWRYPKRKIEQQMNDPKLPRAENVTQADYLRKNLVGKSKNLLLNFITSEKNKEINLLENSTNANSIINRIKNMANWFVKSIKEDIDYILDCLPNNKYDLKGPALNAEIKIAQNVVDEATKDWIKDWQDAIRELKDNDAQVIANAFLVENKTLQLGLLVDGCIIQLAQYAEKWKEDLVYRKGINPGNIEYGVREFEQVLKKTIELDLKSKRIEFYALLFNIINEKGDRAKNFNYLYINVKSSLKDAQEFWIRKWNTGETAFKEETRELKKNMLSNSLELDSVTIDEEPEKFLEPYLEVPSHFQTEYRFQAEKLKLLGAAGKILITAKMKTLENNKSEVAINPNDQTGNNYEKTVKYYPTIQNMTKSFNEIIDQIIIRHIEKLADMWSDKEVYGPFQNFHKYYIHVNNEIIRVIERFDENQPLKSLDDEINLNDMLKSI